MMLAPYSRIGGFLVWAHLVVLSCCVPETGQAHPHVFADYSFAAVFDGRGLKGFEVRWTFDEIFSSEIISAFDKDKNNRFDPREIESVRDVAFAELPDVEYFTLARVDGKARPVKKIREFSVRIKRGRLRCTFFVPLPVRAERRPRSLELMVCDEEYFIDFTLDRSYPVAFIGSSGLRNRVSLRKAPRLAYYFGRVIPEVVKITFRKAK